MPAAPPRLRHSPVGRAGRAAARRLGIPLRAIAEVRTPAVRDPSALHPGDAPPVAGRLLVLFDAECGICLHGRDLLARLDRRDHLAHDLLQRHASGLLADLTEPEFMGSWQVFHPDGRRESEGAAVASVLGALPCGRLLAWPAHHWPAATDRAYRWLATHRVAVSQLLGLAGHPESRRSTPT